MAEAIPLSPLAQSLKERADMIAEHLSARKLATQAEIDACFTEAEEPNLKAAMAYAGLRVLLHERAPDNHDKKTRRKNADRVILDALRGASKAVTLTDPSLDLREVSVHPKSLNALIELAERDHVIGFFNSGVEALRELAKTDPRPDRIDMLARGVRELAYQQRICVWIVTHPGPGLPFPEEDTSPELPAWLGQLSPVDALMIFRAHEEVNAGRLAALQALPRGRKNGDDGERGWGVYLANLASLLNRTAEQLSRDQSLAALFAQSHVHAVDQEHAMDEAKAGR
jgi:hypothetical protein